MGERESTGQHVTEDEAALYDRQIRLWGLEAQTRIRKAHILVINLEGLMSECIKNLVLAGIASLTIVDFRENCHDSDLSAGFFWREEDVGGDRLTPAVARIQNLNPLVKISALPPSSLADIMDPSKPALKNLNADTVVLSTPSGPQKLSSRWSKDSLAAFNSHCRTLSISFYAAGTFGFNGWIFSDLGSQHDYVVERPEPMAALSDSSSSVPLKSDGASDGGPEQATTESSGGAPPSASSSSKRLEKLTQEFVELNEALEMTWRSKSRVEIRRNKPSAGLFGVLALWDLANSSDGEARFSPEEIGKVVLSVMEKKGVEPKVVFDQQQVIPEDFYRVLATSISTPGEFSPTCAILGGVLAQDILNALGGREAPLVNWFQLEGLTGMGLIHQLGTKPSVVMTA